MATVTVLTAITVVLFVAPASPRDLLLVFAIVLPVNIAYVAIQSLIQALWNRLTRKRRQYRNSG